MRTPGSSPYITIWRYTVKPGKIEEFRRTYGAEGAWVSLFRRADGFIETLLVEDMASPTVFVTIDRWESHQSYRSFRKAFASEYSVIDRMCDELTESEDLLGEGVVVR